MSHTVRIFTVQLAESHDHWSHPVSLLLAQGGQNNDVFLDSFLIPVLVFLSSFLLLKIQRL